MAASGSKNPAATVACFLLLLLALVVAAAGARMGPASARALLEAADDDESFYDGSVSALAPQEAAAGLLADIEPIIIGDEPGLQGPVSAPAAQPQEADEDDDGSVSATALAPQEAAAGLLADIELIIMGDEPGLQGPVSAPATQPQEADEDDDVSDNDGPVSAPVLEAAPALEPLSSDGAGEASFGAGV